MVSFLVVINLESNLRNVYFVSTQRGLKIKSLRWIDNFTNIIGWLFMIVIYNIDISDLLDIILSFYDFLKKTFNLLIVGLLIELKANRIAQNLKELLRNYLETVLKISIGPEFFLHQHHDIMSFLLLSNTNILPREGAN